MKIIQISATANRVYGLGEDNQVYYWDSIDGAWMIRECIDATTRKSRLKAQNNGK